MAEDFTSCPICAERINVGDVCATDIEMGTCHFACLDGSPVVDLETGEPLPDGEISKYVWTEEDEGFGAPDDIIGEPSNG